MSDSNAKILAEKILSLKGIVKRKSDANSNTDNYILEGKEFINFPSDTCVNLRLNDVCKCKLEETLTSEPRAKVDSEKPNWVNLSFKNEVDIEIVFVYIRYAWKYLSADLT